MNLTNIDTTTWWSDFFRGHALEVTRRLGELLPTQPEVDAIERYLKPAPGARLLDVPCGGGRHALALGAKGWAVTGVDLSPELIADARAAAAERGLALSFENRDMRDLPWRGAFDAAYCFGNSFAYLGERGDAEFLAAVHAALRPGGQFLLETHFAAESVFPMLQTRDTFFGGRAWGTIGEDMLFLHESKYDALSGWLTSTYLSICGAEREQRSAQYRVRTCLDILRLFERAGFRELQCFGGYNGEPFAIGSQGLYVLATKA